MIPDIDYFLEDRLFNNASWNDIFIFHASFDRALPETDLFFAAQMLLLFAVVNLFTMVASVETLKRVREVLFGKKEEDEEDEEGVEEELKEDFEDEPEEESEEETPED